MGYARLVLTGLTIQQQRVNEINVCAESRAEARQGLVCPHSTRSRGRLAVGALTVWLSSSFLSAGLSVWEAAFLLTQKEEDIPSVLEVSTLTGRLFCVDVAWSSEAPCWGLTRFM